MKTLQPPNDHVVQLTSGYYPLREGKLIPVQGEEQAS